MKRGITLAAVGVLAAQLSLGGPALADPRPTDQTTIEHKGADGSETGTYGQCRYYAGPGGYGMACPGGRRVDGLTMEEILKGDDVPTCDRHVPKPGEPGYVDPNAPKPGGKGGKGTPSPSPSAQPSGAPVPSEPAVEPSTPEEDEARFGYPDPKDPNAATFPLGWYDRLTEIERRAWGKPLDDQEGTVLVFKRCLRGIDPVTRKPTGDIRVDVSPPHYITVEVYEKWKKLTENQETLVKREETAPGNIPVPALLSSPITTPRVQLPVSLYQGVQGGGMQELQAPPELTLQGITLTPSVRGVTFYPEGGNAPVLGAGGKACTPMKVTVDDTPESKPNGCWHTFDHSSALEDSAVFTSRVVTHWRVTISGGPGTNSHVVDFDKTGITLMPVGEVQTIVVRPETTREHQ